MKWLGKICPATAFIATIMSKTGAMTFSTAALTPACVSKLSAILAGRLLLLQVQLQMAALLKTLHAVNWRFTHSTVGAVVTLLAYEERSVADSISQVIVLAIIGRMSAAAVVLFYKSSMSFVSGRSKKGP